TLIAHSLQELPPSTSAPSQPGESTIAYLDGSPAREPDRRGAVLPEALARNHRRTLRKPREAEARRSAGGSQARRSTEEARDAENIARRFLDRHPQGGVEHGAATAAVSVFVAGHSSGARRG